MNMTYFTRHHHRQRPKDQGHDAQNVVRGDGHGVRTVEAFLDGVKRAGADIAKHHSQSPQGQDQFLLKILVFVRVAVTGRKDSLC